ncbi:hypothetical protein ACFWHL_16475 [Streptomyces massasporeus]
MSAEKKQPKQSPAPTDPRVGLNPTGRPRRSSAASRRKHARRAQGGAA